MVPIQRYSRTVTVCLENGVSQMHSVFLTGTRDWSGGGGSGPDNRQQERLKIF